MTCPNCEAGIRDELERLPGVVVSRVSHEEDVAVVTIDPDKVTEKQLQIAVAKAGKKMLGSSPLEE
jgi:copper chaperone CopZ